MNDAQYRQTLQNIHLVLDGIIRQTTDPFAREAAAALAGNINRALAADAGFLGDVPAQTLPGERRDPPPHDVLVVSRSVGQVHVSAEVVRDILAPELVRERVLTLAGEVYDTAIRESPHQAHRMGRGVTTYRFRVEGDALDEGR